MLELREGDKRAFFDAPFNAYGRDSLYVTPMWPDIDRYFDATKNPLFVAGNPFRIFTAHRDGRPDRAHQRAPASGVQPAAQSLTRLFRLLRCDGR